MKRQMALAFDPYDRLIAQSVLKIRARTSPMLRLSVARLLTEDPLQSMRILIFAMLCGGTEQSM